MTHVSTLAPVLETATASRVPRKRSERLLSYNRRSGQVELPGLLGAVLGSHRWFLVRNLNDPTAVVRDTHQVLLGDWEDEESFSVVVSYEVQCIAGGEARLVEALAGSDDHRALLEQLLAMWIRDEAQPWLDDEQQVPLDRIAGTLRARAETTLGLRLRARIRLDGLDEVKDLTIGPRPVHVRIGDHHGRFEVELEAELIADPDRLQVAVQRRAERPQLELELESAVKRFFASEVSLHAFHYDLDSVVVPALRRRLEGVAESHGRRLVRLHLAATTSVDGAQAHVEVRHGFECVLPHHDRTITVQSSALLEIVDIGAYIRAGQPDLGVWARKRIEQVTRAQLYDTEDYAALLTGFGEGRAAIRRDMQKLAKEIGYSITQLVTITDLQVDQLAHPFSVQFEGEFATQTPKAQAGLSTTVNLRISSPNKRVVDLLSREIDVPAHLRDAIREQVALGMIEAAAEEFYLYFRTPRQPEDGAIHVEPETGRTWVQETLEARLSRRVRALLQEDFGAEVFQITFRQTDTEITRRLEELMAKPHPFVVEVEPRGVGLTVTFDGTMLIDGVDEEGWTNFLTRRPTVELVNSTLTRSLASKLSEIHQDDLHNMAFEAMRGHIQGWAYKHLGRQYGLVVEVTDWARRRHADEAGRSEVLEDMVRRRWEQELADNQHRSQTHGPPARDEVHGGGSASG